MRFWDTSAIIPLIVHEPTSPEAQKLLLEDQDIVVWWGTEVECVSALSRVFKDRELKRSGVEDALELLGTLISGWSEIQPVDEVRINAERSAFAYSLRGADALQLGAALLWCDGRTRGAELVCLDHRLRKAARQEGFTILPHA